MPTKPSERRKPASRGAAALAAEPDGQPVFPGEAEDAGAGQAPGQPAPDRSGIRLAIEYVSLAQLLPYAGNSRKHTPQQIDAIAASIRRFGFVAPVLIDAQGTIVAGHARMAAAQRVGLDTVPVVRLGHLTDAERRAYVIADNRLAEMASWDADVLRAEVDQLLTEGISLDELGFSEGGLRAIIGDLTREGGQTDPDDAPAAPTDPVSRPGDCWVLGRHRLLCGDSTSATDVERVLAGVKPHLMVTDPPYGVGYKPGWRSERLQDGAQRAEGEVANDSRADWREAWALFPGDVAYVWHGERQLLVCGEGLAAAGFDLRNLIVWGKPRFVIGRGHYHSQHETCWYAVRKGATGHWAGDRSQSTLWQIEHIKSDTGHSTQKPVEAMRRPIENNSSPGQAVYEPFSGSGTTIIAAEQTGRACHAIELNPAYVDVGLRRWQEFTGQDAVLDNGPDDPLTGKTWGEVADQRRGLKSAA